MLSRGPRIRSGAPGRVSCVPASCVHIWFVSCPCLMWLLVNSCPAVFVSLSMIYLCICSPVCSVWFRLVYSLLPGVSLALSCPALMSPLKTVYLSLPPRLRVPVSSSCVHRDMWLICQIKCLNLNLFLFAVFFFLARSGNSNESRRTTFSVILVVECDCHSGKWLNCVCTEQD